MKLEGRLKANDIARSNTCEFARGYRDLLILLESPSNTENQLRHNESGGLPGTIDFIDNQLQQISKARNWHNTCIVDMKSYRSESIS